MWPATRAYIGGRDHKRSSADHFTTVREADVTYSVPEPVIVVPVISMMARLPPHPYAAILLYDFILTPESNRSMHACKRHDSCSR